MTTQVEKYIKLPLSEQMVAEFEKAIEKLAETTGRRMSLTEFTRRAAIRYAMEIHAGKVDPWAS